MSKLKKMTKKQFHDMLWKREWEGGLGGFISYGADSYVTGTELEPLFKDAEKVLNQIDEKIQELSEKFGEPEYE